MGRRPRPVFWNAQKSSYYCRVKGSRWSCETNDEVVATERYRFMECEGKPWNQIREKYTAHVSIMIDTEGGATATLHRFRAEAGAEGEKVIEDITTHAPSEAISLLSGKVPEDTNSIPALLDKDMGRHALKPKGTQVWYEQKHAAMKRFVAHEGLTLATLDESAAVKYVQHRMGERRTEGRGANGRAPGPATLIKEVSYWRETWARWRDQGRVKVNPWTSVVVQRGKDVHEQIHYTPEQIASIVGHMPELEGNAAMLQAILGCRPGKELFSISREDVDLGRIYSSKGKVKRYDHQHYSEAAKLVFDRVEGRMGQLTADRVNKAFKLACEAAKVPVGTPYDLRHSFATLARTGADIEVVQGMMRHREIGTTMIYASVPNDEVSAAADRVQRKIAGGKGKSDG